MTWAARGAVLGFIFSFFASTIFSTRIYKAWIELPPPPVVPVEIISGPVQVPIVEGPSGSMLAYYPDTWINIESVDDLPNWGPVTEEECDTGSEEFWLAPNAPNDVIQCVSLSQPMFEANFSTMVAMNADGSIWVRNISRYASDGLVSLGLFVVPPGIGAVLGWILHAVTRLREKWAG